MAATEHRIEVPGLGEMAALHDNATPVKATYLMGARTLLGEYDTFGRHLANTLPRFGIEMWRFQTYDAPRDVLLTVPQLEQAWRAAIGQVRQPGRPLIIGGRQEAGRAASQVVARRADVDGLALFDYELHAWGRAKQLHTRHFASITVPILLCSRPGMWSLTQAMHAVAASMPNVTASVIEAERNLPDGEARAAAVALLDFIEALLP